MRMRQVDAIEITPSSTTALEPGGLHVMLVGLKQPLVNGQGFSAHTGFLRKPVL
ncbi:hypothetical protein RLIN73S_03923 [Rhodanobacter lindaniclasticus]